MKLATKLSITIATLVVLMAGLGVFSLVQMSAINHASEVIADGWMPRVILAEEINTDASDYRIRQLQFIFARTPQEMDALEEKIRKTRESLEKKVAQLEALLVLPEGKKVVVEFKLLWADYIRRGRQIRSLSRENKNDQAMALVNGENQKAYEAISDMLQTLVTLNTEGAGKASAEGDAAYGQSRTLVIVLLALAVLLAAGLGASIVRGTLRQLGKDPGELAHLAKDVAGGNLNVPKDGNAVGVYAEILVMVENLKEHIESAQRESEKAREESRKAHEAMLQAEAAGKDAQTKRDSMLAAADRLEEVVNIVSSASAELSAQIEQSDRGATEQAAQVTETAAAMNEMNATVLEVTKNAGNASDASVSTREKAEQGAKVVQEAVAGIREVREDSLALKEDMIKLDENARSIDQIMGVISDIADQTNLLALNAAIEAARAGEAGRGFAVVADEVRKLAEKTMASTTDVGNAIKAIQSSTARSMAQVDNTVNNIEKTTELASRSGQALQEIVNMVDNTSDQVRAIATASEQQSASSEEINKSIAQVNTIADETARAMREAAKAVSELAAQAQVLSGLIDDMKHA